jgi:ABC-type lipoprotein export system ATPase subunit
MTADPASSPTQPVVRIAGVDKTFARGDRAVTKALEGIDLEISSGEFVSLIGPSGCGKSTLLRIVGDLISPSTGTVTVNGKPAAQARRDRDYGMVFQAPVLFDWRTVEDNVKLPLEILGQDAATRTKRAREMLELVELGEFLDHHPYQLSGGMQQRVVIAIALASNPKLLVLCSTGIARKQVRCAHDATMDIIELFSSDDDQIETAINVRFHDIAGAVQSESVRILPDPPTIQLDVECGFSHGTSASGQLASCRKKSKGLIDAVGFQSHFGLGASPPNYSSIDTGVREFAVASSGRVYALKSNGDFMFSDDGRAPNYSLIDHGVRTFFAAGCKYRTNGEVIRSSCVGFL